VRDIPELSLRPSSSFALVQIAAFLSTSDWVGSLLFCRVLMDVLLSLVHFLSGRQKLLCKDS
jgi:hypothetical protein